jgi:serine/threonine protein kinase
VLAAFHAAGRGLAAAHEAGVLHRDFKPANVLVGAGGRVQVTDFGLAAPGAPAAWVAPDAAASSAGALVGTPAYMSPEQIFLRPVDARADQWSFSASLYEALYGAPPFGGASLEERRWQLASREAPAPADHRGAPRAIAAVLRRGLSTEPGGRFPSMRALLDALDRAEHQGDATHIRLNIAVQVVASVGHAATLVSWARTSAGSGEATSTSTLHPTEPPAGEAGPLLTGVVTLMFVGALVVFAGAPLGVVWAPLNALGLWRRWGWARRSTMIYGALAILSCFGLPYGIYAIWSLHRPGVRDAFTRR